MICPLAVLPSSQLRKGRYAVSVFSGKLVKGDNVVLDNVVGSLKQDAEGWTGQFVLPKGTSVETGDYELILKDGKKGRVFIGLATWEALPSSLIVPFDGTGPLE
jgi:hypothetical protein